MFPALSNNTEVRYVESVSPSTKGLVCALQSVAQSHAPVLIVGEAGSGKYTLAHEIHRMSGGTPDNFIAVDCSTLSSDLFGDNRFRECTLLFQEISRMSADHQFKTVQRFFNGNNVGNGAAPPRLIASSRHTLSEDVRRGKFREDLYYGISSFSLCIPPLRQRREDIPVLAQDFAAKYSSLLGRPTEISQHVLQVLSAYSWPGNVRELEYTIRAIVAIGDENIALAAIRASGFNGIRAQDKLESMSLKQAAREASRRAERELILNALSRTHWNRKRAARNLQISYKALLYKLKQIGIDDTSLGVEG